MSGDDSSLHITTAIFVLRASEERLPFVLFSFIVKQSLRLQNTPDLPATVTKTCCGHKLSLTIWITNLNSFERSKV